MQKIIATALAFSLLLSAAHATDAVDQAALQKVIDTLDVTSFPNSIGPRRGKGKVTLKDCGASDVAFSSQTAVVSEPDGSWQFTLTLLRADRICFEDQAKHGGSYHAQHAYALTADASGFLKAAAVEDTACPAFAK